MGHRSNPGWGRGLACEPGHEEDKKQHPRHHEGREKKQLHDQAAAHAAGLKINPPPPPAVWFVGVGGMMCVRPFGLQGLRFLSKAATARRNEFG